MISDVQLFFVEQTSIEDREIADELRIVQKFDIETTYYISSKICNPEITKAHLFTNCSSISLSFTGE